MGDLGKSLDLPLPPQIYIRQPKGINPQPFRSSIALLSAMIFPGACGHMQTRGLNVCHAHS